jgi:hypothetical protein
MRRIAQRAVPCQTTRQNQTKWVILKEKCFKAPSQRRLAIAASRYAGKAVQTGANPHRPGGCGLPPKMSVKTAETGDFIPLCA